MAHAPRPRKLALPVLLPILMALLPAPAAAQVQESSGPLRVFVDCTGFCDTDFLKTEVDWVSYMRDAADAQVHLLITSEGTGGGGIRQTLNFIGRRELAGIQDTLHYTSTSEDTQDTRRRGLTRVIAAGLVRYAAQLEHYADRLTVSMAPVAPTITAPVAAPEEDPWNFWTFRLGLSGGSSGETNRDNYSISSSASANRTTEAWKVNLSARGNYNESSYVYPIGKDRDTTIVSIRRSYSLSGLGVKSLGPHLSAGLRGSLSTSTYGNIEYSVDLAPAVEYNLFPYAENTRRSLTASYSAGVRAFNYREVTLYGVMEQTVPSHTLDLSYATRQPWGSVSIGASGSQYLHDTSLYNLSTGGGLSDIRLFRGFSMSVFGNYVMVRDQITLPARNATPDEILLRQRELATNYRYSINMSLNYRFGSIFNNVVNPRMDGGGGGGMMIFF